MGKPWQRSLEHGSRERPPAFPSLMRRVDAVRKTLVAAFMKARVVPPDINGRTTLSSRQGFIGDCRTKEQHQPPAKISGL